MESPAADGTASVCLVLSGLRTSLQAGGKPYCPSCAALPMLFPALPSTASSQCLATRNKPARALLAAHLRPPRPGLWRRRRCVWRGRRDGPGWLVAGIGKPSWLARPAALHHLPPRLASPRARQLPRAGPGQADEQGLDVLHAVSQPTEYVHTPYYLYGVRSITSCLETGPSHLRAFAAATASRRPEQAEENANFVSQDPPSLKKASTQTLPSDAGRDHASGQFQCNFHAPIKVWQEKDISGKKALSTAGALLCVLPPKPSHSHLHQLLPPCLPAEPLLLGAPLVL